MATATYTHEPTSHSAQLVICGLRHELIEHIWTAFQVSMQSQFCETTGCVLGLLPCSVQVDLTWVQFNILLLIKDAVDDGLQHLMQIQHANSLTAKQCHMFQTLHLHLCCGNSFIYSFCTVGRENKLQYYTAGDHKMWEQTQTGIIQVLSQAFIHSRDKKDEKFHPIWLTHLHELLHGLGGKRIGTKESVRISCESKTKRGWLG